MNPRLQHLYEALETDRLRLLDTISKLSPEKFHHSTAGKWSISQILAHLVAAERLSRIYLNKKALGIDQLTNTGFREEAKMILLRWSQRLPLKFKAPKAVVDHTPSFANVADLSVAWGAERNELKKLLETFRDDQINKKIYRHVRAGMLNIQHALMFLREHQIHHWPQIKRLL